MYLVKKGSKCLFWGKPYITLVYTSKIKPYRVYVVWVKIWAKNTLHTSHNSYTYKNCVQTLSTTVSTRQMLRISYIWPDWNSYVRLGVFHTIFSTKRSHYCFFLEISVIKFLIIRFLTSVAYCTINPILLQFEAQAVRARDVWFTSESRCRYRDL